MSPTARRAIELVRQGQVAAALELGLLAVAEAPEDVGLRIFTGMLLAREVRLEEALEQFSHALGLAPQEVFARLESARILVGLDRVDEAETQLAQVPDGSEKSRVAAQIQRRRGDPEAAVRTYRAIVAGEPQDFESWGQLGVCLVALGRPAEGAEALAHSLRIRRTQAVFRDKWADAEVLAGRGEDALRRALDYDSEHPADPLIQTTIARLHSLMDRPDLARAAIDEALHRAPDHVGALLVRAEQDEAENRMEAFAQTLERLAAIGVRDARLDLLEARLAYRRGDYETALATAEHVPAGADPGSRALLIGQINDRLDDADRAFAAFEAMNRETALEVVEPQRQARRFRDTISDRARLASRSWIRSWPRPRPLHDRPAPVFMIGFPRSGTTLLDTLLMGHPDVIVAEEKPMLGKVAEAAGGYERLAALGPDRIEALRSVYFEEAARHVDGLSGTRLLIDKLPLGTIEVPLIHRIFPDARFIFVQRHPCDVVLSGFMTRFQPVEGMTNFLTLDDTARLYARVLDFWTHCRAVLPLVLHLVRYERLVEDVEAELRPLASFLNLPWSDRMLDHRRTAQDRGHVATPSYAQITEQINDRSVGRWERYRDRMEGVLPILKPWAERMGYPL
ncbi:tetratricopeptide repeat-containing sulfotransferase family protein [Sphingomonas ginkgonis]|nr:tetratricopeptide repeat-containing sulfotransferase family protein [Sphingomonas ginkgonis]